LPLGMALATLENKRRSTRRGRLQMQRSRTPKLTQQQHSSLQFSISYCFLPVALALDGQLVSFIQPRQNETGLRGQNGEIQEYTEP